MEDEDDEHAEDEELAGTQTWTRQEHSRHVVMTADSCYKTATTKQTLFWTNGSQRQAVKSLWTFCY